VQDTCHLWGRLLVSTAEGKRQLGRPRHRMEDNIKIVIKEIFRQGVDWTDLIRDRDTWRAVVDTAMNRLFFCLLITFSNRNLLLGLSWLFSWLVRLFVRSETMTHIRNARTHASRSSAACLVMSFVLCNTKNSFPPPPPQTPPLTEPKRGGVFGYEQF
jgi:hypothetical protein